MCGSFIGLICFNTNMDNIENLEGEIWKDIEGYPNYSISNLCRIKRKKYSFFSKDGKVRHKKEYILKLTHKNGYLVVRLFNGSSPYGRLESVHRLIAKAFIPNPDNKPYIDHINTIRDDNRIENLRWCTTKENANNPNTIEKQRMIAKDYYSDKIKGKEKREKISNSVKILYSQKEYLDRFIAANRMEDVVMNRRLNNPQRKEVFHYDENGVYIEKFTSSREAARKNGCSQSSISGWCLKKKIPRNKHIWTYE